MRYHEHLTKEQIADSVWLMAGQGIFEDVQKAVLLGRRVWGD
jgi:hypothetical protein